jgi:plastocyanin
VLSAVLLRPTGERAALSGIHGDPVFPQLAQ